MEKKPKKITILLFLEQFYQVATHSELVSFWEPKLLEAESFDLGSSFSSLGNMTYFQTNAFSLYLEGANKDGCK